MKKPFARRREPYMWRLRLRLNLHIYEFLSGTKAISSRS
jgi:hypothetical protein